METNWTAIRLYYGEKAFGLSGNFTTDLKKLCAKHRANIFHIEDQGGYSPKGSMARPYLFGGSSNGIFNIAEIVVQEADKENLLTEVKKIAKAGKDSFAYCEFQLHGIINADE